jgi:osmotically-inducible protein OsmY
VILFGFYFVSNRSDATSAEKAKQAAVDVGDAVRDTGVATLVSARLTKTFGFEANRFLHAHFDNGRVLLYGMVPVSLDQQQLLDEAAKVPGVKEVEILVQVRPEYIPPLRTLGDEPVPAPTPEPAVPPAEGP